MAKYEIVSTRKWSYGDQEFNPGDVLGELEADLAPVLLLDAERSGKLQVQSPPAQKDPDDTDPDDTAS